MFRLLPLFAIVLAAIHWSWTATIFIGPGLDMTTFVVLISFVMLSVAIIGIAPATPVTCVVYLIPMWLVTAYMFLRTEWVSAGTFVVLFAALAAVLWSAFYIVVSGVRKCLVRGDEVDLLVASSATETRKSRDFEPPPHITWKHGRRSSPAPAMTFVSGFMR